MISGNDVVAVSTALAVADSGSKDIDFGRIFSSVPTVTAAMQAGADDRIIGVQISETTLSGCTVQFTDDIPNGNYAVKVLASI